MTTECQIELSPAAACVHIWMCARAAVAEKVDAIEQLAADTTERPQPAEYSSRK